MSWLYLLLAIIFETIGTTGNISLQVEDGNYLKKNIDFKGH